MRTAIIALITAVLLCTVSFIRLGQPPLPYSINDPDIRYRLPDTLREISGLSIIDNTTFACVQDENGILFIYNYPFNTIVEQIPFEGNGDYEGICIAGSTIYILRSDGVIIEIHEFQKEDRTSIVYETDIPARDNEGLCYDAAHHRLLIACKSDAGDRKEMHDKRVVYAFDLNRKILEPEPAYQFSVQEAVKFAKKENLDVPQKKSGDHKVPVIKFRMSAIAVHPLSAELYILSAKDHLLFVYEGDGKLHQIVHLDEKLFNKPEGISFLPNGDMFITNEGQDKYPTLLLFKYRPVEK